MFLMALLLMASQSFAGESCEMDVIPSAAGDFVSRLEKISLDGCQALNMDPLGSESMADLQNKALRKCCKRANDFIKKHAQSGSPYQNLKSMIELSVKLCDGIDDSEMNYQRSVCLVNTTLLLDDPDGLVQHRIDRCQAKTNEKYSGEGVEGVKNMDRRESYWQDCVLGEIERVKKSLGRDPTGAQARANDAKDFPRKTSDGDAAQPAGSAPVVDPARAGF